VGIPRKKGTCPSCPPGTGPVILIDGKCRSHYWQALEVANQLSAKKFSNNRLDNQISESIKNQRFASQESDRKQVEKQRLNQISDDVGFQTLAQYYSDGIRKSETLGWACENCYNSIYVGGLSVKISCQAHILPKEDFPSVAFNKYNWLLLGGTFSKCGCHYKFDFSWTKAAKMHVFPLAISRFLLFKKYLTKFEISRLPDPFVKYL
jgi:hypothetical protein